MHCFLYSVHCVFLFGTAIDEKRFRHRDPADVRLGFSNITLPHREWLADRIIQGLNANKGESLHIVEIGCGWGPNLAVLARREQALQLTGVDISPASILEGRKRLQELGLNGITLLEMKGDDLNIFATDSANVVFTDAMLLYIGPDKIQQTIQEMIRVARDRLLFLEMHSKGASPGGYYMKDGWIRDYEALLSLFVGKDAVHLEKISPRLRDAGRWPKYGTLVEVDLTNKTKKGISS